MSYSRSTILACAFFAVPVLAQAQLPVLDAVHRSGSVAGSVAAVSAAALPQSADGSWSGTIETPGPAMPFNLVIKTHGDSVSGTVKRSSGDVPLYGTIKGDTLTFFYTILYNDNPFTVNLQGVVSGDSFKGQADYGEGNLLSFDLKRVSEGSAL